jgi:hypothetical protein
MLSLTQLRPPPKGGPHQKNTLTNLPFQRRSIFLLLFASAPAYAAPSLEIAFQDVAVVRDLVFSP